MAEGDEQWVRITPVDLNDLTDTRVNDPSGSSEPIVMKLAADGSISDILGAVKGLNATSTPSGDGSAPAAAPASASGDGGGDGGCCDAYPAAVLTAALGSPLDPKTLWAVLEDDERHELAEAELKDAASDRRQLLARSAWATAPEMVLLDELPEQRAKLAGRILEARTGIDQHSVARRKAEADNLAAQAKVTANSAEVVIQVVAQMRKWHDLADSGLSFLKWSTVFSMLGIAYVLLFLIHGGKVDAAEGPVLIFLLALFAVSPAVLLLRERPLEGIDKFSPSGTSGGDEGGDGGSGGGDQPS